MQMGREIHILPPPLRGFLHPFLLVIGEGMEREIAIKTTTRTSLSTQSEGVVVISLLHPSLI
jgi:hypothetical protein